MMDRFLRTVVFNWLPESFRLRGNMKGLESRPQATFLPQIPVHGIGYVIPQMVSQRYKEEQAHLHTASPSLTTTNTPAAAV